MMTMATKRDIFQEHLEKYLKANKQEKGELLDHVCAVTGLHRKAAVRKFRRLATRGPTLEDGRGRPTVYGPDVTAALRTIWEAGNEVCGELLHPIVDEYIDIFIRDNMWNHRKDATEKLRTMSESTVKRRVSFFMRIRRGHKGISSTKPSHLKHIVQIFTGPWKDKIPGNGQLDTVRHSDSAFGDAVYTVNYTDAAALFVIPRAQCNKGEKATVDLLSEEKSICDNFYLTGGTALAEFYLHHRLSEDLDFFSEHEFDPQSISVVLKKIQEAAGIRSIQYNFALLREYMSVKNGATCFPRSLSVGR